MTFEEVLECLLRGENPSEKNQDDYGLHQSK